MNRLRKTGTAFLLISVAIVTLTAGFKREYAVPAGGLLDLEATLKDGAIVVTGVLLGSGGRVTGTTLTRYGDVVLVRVYATAIEDSDDAKTVRGTFAAVVPNSRVRSVMIGERSNSVTVGRLYGLPIRIPRIPRQTSVALTVWPQNDRERRIGTVVECKDAAKAAIASEAPVVAYGKALDVAKLDPALPSRRFEDWLSSSLPKADAIDWSKSDCDLKPEGPEPADGWPLCVKARLRQGDVWGWVTVVVGTTRLGIHGEPRVTYVAMTSKALAMKGQFRDADALSQLPRLIAEVEEADAALGKDK